MLVSESDLGTIMDARQLPVVEIFSSYQGEGANSGRPVTFIRLAGCNLNCPWCDTDISQARTMSFSEIMLKVVELHCSSVIVTGGEPTIHGRALQDLIVLLRMRADVTWIGLETNGVISPEGCIDKDLEAKFDYVACSPKFEYADRYDSERMIRQADEIRIVASTLDIVSFCVQMRERIVAKRYYISPCERDGRMDFATAYSVLDQLNSGIGQGCDVWYLSVQTHKLIGIR